MPRRKKKIRYEDTPEYKKDVIYEIRFIKGNKASQWFNLFGDPEENPKLITMAIEQFKAKGQIPNWDEKTDKHETRSYWFG